MDLTLGQGQDQLILGGSSVGANISLDLFDGVEAGADLVIFQGSISGLSIQDFGDGDMLVFPTGQIFDELNENIPTATIDGLTNDGTQAGQIQIGVSFDATIEAALVQRTLTYSVFENGTWSESTEEFSVVTLGALF